MTIPNSQYPGTPQTIAEIHGALWQDVVEICAQWQAWNALYENARNVDVLSWAAVGFFGSLRQWLLDSVILGVARVTDPVQTRARVPQDNLVVERLAVECDAVGESVLAATVRSNLAAAQPCIRKLKDHRNKRIAHSDLAHGLASAGAVLPPILGQDIEQALNFITEAMNAVEAHFENGRTTAYDRFFEVGAAAVLVQRLQVARDVANSERRRIGMDPE